VRSEERGHHTIFADVARNGDGVPFFADSPPAFLTLQQAAHRLTALGRGLITYNRLFVLFTRQVARPPIRVYVMDMGRGASPRNVKHIRAEDLPALAEFLCLTDPPAAHAVVGADQRVRPSLPQEPTT